MCEKPARVIFRRGQDGPERDLGVCGRFVRIINPEAPDHLLALAVAGAIGFLGNMAAAFIRTRAGRRLHSPALVADGNHARADAYVSLGVILSAVVVALGFDVADPLIALAITAVILRITWQSWRTIRHGIAHA